MARRSIARTAKRSLAGRHCNRRSDQTNLVPVSAVRLRKDEFVIQRIRIFLLPWLLVIALASAPALQHVWATALQVRNSLSDGDSGHIRFRSANALAGGLLDGRPITPSAVDGELTLPGQCTRPFPAVVVLH